MKIELPKKVLFIINNLQLAGYDAFAVGGCVRDCGDLGINGMEAAQG